MIMIINSISTSISIIISISSSSSSIMIIIISIIISLCLFWEGDSEKSFCAPNGIALRGALEAGCPWLQGAHPSRSLQWTYA